MAHDQQAATLLAEFRHHEQDNGSTEVQVVRLSDRIQHITEHLKSHVKDHSSRLGLLRLVGHRRRLLNYLRTNDPGRYRLLIQKLGIRK